MAPVSTGLGEIYEFYLESDRHSPMELRTLLDWVVSYRLRSVPGVIEVNTMGGEVKQYQVVLDPRKMAGFKLIEYWPPVVFAPTYAARAIHPDRISRSSVRL